MRFKITSIFAACVLLLSSCKKDNDPAIGVGSLLNNNILVTALNKNRVQLYSITPDGTSITQITNFSNLFLQSATWSPDHSKIVYVDNGLIYMMNADGSNLVKLSDDLTVSYNASLSPNGKKIVYLTRFLAPEGNTTNITEQIAIMNSNGTGKTQITNLYTSNYNYLNLSSPVWSPDGSKIAFIAQPDVGSYKNEVYTINADGSGLTLVVPDQAPGSIQNICYSPDGSTLMMQILKGSNNINPDGIYTCNINNPSNIKMLFSSGSTASTTYLATPPSYSPDGSQIVTGSFKDNPNGDMYIINLNGTVISRLTNNSFTQVLSTSWR